MEQLSMTLLGTWYFMANDNKGSRHSPVFSFLKVVQCRDINSDSEHIRVLICKYGT